MNKVIGARQGKARQGKAGGYNNYQKDIQKILIKYFLCLRSLHRRSAEFIEAPKSCCSGICSTGNLEIELTVRVGHV